MHLAVALGRRPRPRVLDAVAPARRSDQHQRRLRIEVLPPIDPPITVNVGWLGLRHILAHGGTGYFPVRMLREHLAAGRLYRVVDAPEFRLTAYLCYSASDESEPLASALDSIRRVAGEAA